MPERKPFGAYAIDIQALAKLLEMRKRLNNHTTLLVGARTGALFRSKQFYESLQQFSNRGFSHLTQAEQFGECYSILTKPGLFSETDIHGILRDSLQDLTITKAEDCLAELVKYEHFDEIISTNVDGFIEQSLIQSGMKEGHDFEVTIAGHGRLGERSFPHRIIKVFGDFSPRDYTISNRRAHLERPELARLLSSILEKDLLVVGIDPLWDEAILHAIPMEAGSMWFVNEEDLMQHSFTCTILQERQATYILSKEGSFDNFVRTLHGYLYGGIPINHQLVLDLSKQLFDLSNQLQVLQHEQRTILSEIKKIQDEIGNLSQRWDQQ